MDCIETIVKKGGDGSFYLEDRKTKIIRVTEFSNTNKHAPGKGEVHAAVLQNDESFNVGDYIYYIAVYPKGRNSSTEDLVFLKFELYPSKNLYCSFHKSINCRAEWTYLVSVVDSEGCLRYPQSFTWIFDGTESLDDSTDWVQVVSADSLLKEAEVLLPQDKLTIQVDMVLKQYYTGDRCTHSTYREILGSSFGEEELPYELYISSNITLKDLPLRLDSPLGKLLRRESQYFERLCATPMAEKKSGYLEIPKEEEDTFIDMMKILRHPHTETKAVNFFASIKSILDIYALAHFYGIERVLNTCRCWLRLICRKNFSCVTEEQVSAISELAEFYNDSILREIVGALAMSEDETETQNGVDVSTTFERRRKMPGIWNDRFIFVQPEENRKKEQVTENASALSHCYI